jgi:hypothetical protein
MNEIVHGAEGSFKQGTAIPSAPGDRALAWATLLGLSAVFVISAIWRPADEPTIILCPFRAITGLLCPGCGMTRAFCALGHLEFRRAIHFNAISPVLFLSFAVMWVGAAATLLNFQKVRAAVSRLWPNSTAAVVILVLVMVWWGVRLALGF